MAVQLMVMTWRVSLSFLAQTYLHLYEGLSQLHQQSEPNLKGNQYNKTMLEVFSTPRSVSPGSSRLNRLGGLDLGLAPESLNRIQVNGFDGRR